MRFITHCDANELYEFTLSSRLIERLIRRRLSASSKSHGESAAAQDFCQDEILPEKRALLQSSNTDNVILCRAVVSPRPHGQTAFCSLYFNYCWQHAFPDLHSLCLTWVHVHNSSDRRASAVAVCAWRQWLETRQAIASSDHVFVTLLSRECLYSGNWRSILSVRYYVLLTVFNALFQCSEINYWSEPERAHVDRKAYLANDLSIYVCVRHSVNTPAL